MKIERVLRICGISAATVRKELPAIFPGQISFALEDLKEGLQLRIAAEAAEAEKAVISCSKFEEAVRERLGWHIYGEDRETLEEVVGRVMSVNKFTISTAESCSGGLLAHRLTNVPGSSAYFQLGLVTYDNSQKERLLGVNRQLLAAKGAVSEEVAAAMARGARKAGLTDVGIGITGIAGPSGGSALKPVGLVYLALDFKGDIIAEKKQFQGERMQIKGQAAYHALMLLWRKLASAG